MDWFKWKHSPKQVTEEKFSNLGFTTKAYHLNGISRGVFWTNEIALFLFKEMHRMEPYHFISFEISCISSGKWCRSEPGIKLLTTMVGKFLEIPVRIQRVVPFSRKKKFTGTNRIIWGHTGITGFFLQMVSAPCFQHACARYITHWTSTKRVHHDQFLNDWINKVQLMKITFRPSKFHGSSCLV